MNKPLRIYKASAGSGKTFRLAVEYISLLAINPMEYQNILAVTFTNKATAEMKQRILGTLYGIANGLPSASDYVDNILACIKEKLDSDLYDETSKEALAVNNSETLRQRAKEALSNIIHDYSRFHIETIDSFFQSILHEIANELDLSVNMRIELDEDMVLSEAVDTIIENLKEDSQEFDSIISFINEKINQNRSWNVNDTIKDFGKNIFKESYLIHGEDARTKITNKSTIISYKKKIEDFCEAKKRHIIDTASKMLDICHEIDYEKNAGKKGIITTLDKIQNFNLKDDKIKKGNILTDKEKEPADNVDLWFSKNKNKHRDILQPRIESDLMPMFHQLIDLCNDYTSHYNTTRAATQHIFSLMLLNKISETVHEQNNEKSRFLLSETANFLRDVINDDDIPFIYEKAGSVIKHIMIDEFQDTSTLQWGNFKPLIMNSIASNGSCLIVGDVKQSIYRFRNSDWQILNGIEHDADLQGLIGDIPARYNFRSSRNVVDFNNALFTNAAKLLKTRCPDLVTAYGDVEQVAKKSEDKGFVRVENIDYHHTQSLGTQEEEDDDNQILSSEPEEDIPTDKAMPCEQKECTPEEVLSDDIGIAMLQKLRANIEELVSNGVNANDITILVRRNSEVLTISDYFNEIQDNCSIKVVSDNAFRLDASPAIGIIINALRALNTDDNHMQLICLAYNYAKYVTHHPNPLSLTLCRREEIDTHLPDGFRGYDRETLRNKSIIEQAESIYDIFQLDRIKGQDSYMFCFHDILEHFCNDNQASVTLFLEEWDSHLCETTIPNGTSDGVRIMTMHKSKGLEFHTVIIPSCMWDIKPKDKETIWCTPNASPYDEMPLLPISFNMATQDSIFAEDRNEEDLKTLVDNINVLYVAFTRAKNNLIILTGNSNKTQAKPSSEEIETAQDFVVKSIPDTMVMTKREEDDVTQWQYGKIVASEKEAENVPEEEDVQPSTKEKENALETTYRPLNVDFVSNNSVAEFRQSYESDLFITAEATDMKTQQHHEKIRLISLGNLYHNIFQMIHTSADIPHAVSILESKGCFESLLEADEARDTVASLINGIETDHPEWFSCEWRVLNERNILFSQDGIYATKRPDRVVVRDDQAIIIDYKTARGAAKTEANGKVSVPNENKKQIADYKRLLDEMGYKDVKAYLWYIFDDIVAEVNV